MRNVYVLTHGGCTDGFGSAWAHYRSMINFPPAEPTRVSYIPERHHQWSATQALLKRADLQKLEIIYADIVPDRDLLVSIHAKAKAVTVYDHHETAYEKVGDLPYCFFDMKRSGAGIMWDIFNPGFARPRLVDVVEDADLWRWALPRSREHHIVLETTKYDFVSWDRFAADLEDPERERKIFETGAAFCKYRDIVTRKLLGHNKVHKLTLKGPDGLITMPAVNASIFQSGLGNALALKPGPCSAIYYGTGKHWLFSLRSTNSGPNVAKIAEQYGGGGHRNASGFKINSLSDLQVTEYSEAEQELILLHVSRCLRVENFREAAYSLETEGGDANHVLEVIGSAVRHGPRPRHALHHGPADGADGCSCGD